MLLSRLRAAFYYLTFYCLQIDYFCDLLTKSLVILNKRQRIVLL